MINIGFIDYANCLPVYYSFDKEYRGKYNMIGGTPAELNHLMKSGELIASNISSIEYALNPELYMIIPDICVGSLEKIMSVNLYTHMQLTELNGKRISLTNSSATSQILLKILLKKAFQYNNEYVEVCPDLDAMLGISAAALIIGDEALTTLNRRDMNIYDLGELWNKWTGLPFTFSLWVINRKWAISNPVQAKEIVMDFNKSLTKGLENIEEIIEGVSNKLIGVDVAQYFNNMNYFLTEKYQESLLLFYRLAAEIGLIPECNKLVFCDL